ncbi:DUF6624 domain-containing protein [uncultured Flavobacterium sp.]|uniref:DUF6624 domain-containing protein n=1 Tax=uncultured Flavobacterium sp. TaxID=165435 RepID=UPI0030EE0611|tara:strand:- start:1737 stop:2714 length:978 start_codon:yes stop_codon:yes gene_type:complete
MKKTTLLVIIGLLLFNTSFGQDKEKYASLINEAWKLYKTKEYLQSAEKYSEAFAVFENKEQTSDRYNAACSWALANKIDSSFSQLFIIARNGTYVNLGHISTDTDLDVLHSDKRWNKIIKLVTKNKEKAEENLDKPLVAVLDTIYQEDQKYRQQTDAIEKKYGWESKEMKDHRKIIHEKDSINLTKVKAILDKQGWLGTDIVGGQGNSTLFLVIQHSDQATQEKYLPMMREAVKNRKAQGSSLALLEDRVALGQGKRQIYGSQVSRDKDTKEYFVLPLEDAINVDKRRAEVGLGKLQDYISNWGMTWSAEEYIKKLPEIEAKVKK